MEINAPIDKHINSFFIGLHVEHFFQIWRAWNKHITLRFAAKQAP